MPVAAPVPRPQWLVDSFALANQPQFATDKTAHYGPYNRLLYHLFGLEGPFESTPQHPVSQTPGDTTYVVMQFTVEFNNHPLLSIKVKPPASFAFESKRKQADDWMCDYFRDLCHNLVTPRLTSISAFCIRLAFYEYVAATNTLAPPAIAADPVSLNDMASADRWNDDLFAASGLSRICPGCQRYVRGSRSEGLKLVSIFLLWIHSIVP